MKRPWHLTRKTMMVVVFLGLLAWALGGLADHVFFHRPKIWLSLSAWGDSREIFMRSTFLALFLVFGLVLGNVVERLRQKNSLLHEKMESLSVTLMSIGDGVITTDSQGRVVRMNRVAESLTGWKEAEAAGRPMEEVFHIFRSESASPAENPAERVLREGVVVGLANDTALVSRDGTVRQIADSGAPIFNRQGRMIGVVLVFRDVTLQYARDRDIRVSQATLQSILRSAPVGIGMVRDRVIQWSNDRLGEITGYSTEELAGQSSRIIYPDEEEFLRVGTEQFESLGEEGLGEIETRWKTKGGEERDILLRITPTDPRDPGHGVTFTAMDITLRKHSEERVKHLNAVLRAIRGINQLIIKKTDSRTLLRKACELLIKERGYGKSWIMLLGEDGRILDFEGFEYSGDDAEPLSLDWKAEGGEALPRCVSRALASGEAMIGFRADELCASCPLGSAENPENSCRFMARLGMGEPGSGFLTVTLPDSSLEDREERELFKELADDISFALYRISLEAEKRESQKQLALSQERYRAMFNNMQSGVAVYRPSEDGDDFLFVDFNKAAERICRVPRDQVLGKSLLEAFPKMDRFGLPQAMGQVHRTGVPQRLPAFFYEDEVRQGWRENYLYKLPSGEVVAIFDDATEKRLAEQRLELETRILEILSREKHGKDLIREILLQIKDHTGLDALAISIQEGQDFPFFLADGFDDRFLRMEKHLGARDTDGGILMDKDGNPVLECMCGVVMRGMADPDLPFFTEGGSFWTNSTEKLLVSVPEDQRSATRNRFHAQGFESVAIIPLRSKEKIIGLLQMNDRRPDMYSLGFIRFFERLSLSIGVALERALAEEEMAKLASLIDASEDFIGIADLDGNVDYVNPAGCRMVGLDGPEQARRTRIRHYIREDSFRLTQDKSVPAGLRSGSWKGSGKLPHFRTGILMDVDVHFFIIKDPVTSDPVSAAFIMQDTTEKKRMAEERTRLQGQLLHAQKLEAIGTLAGGIAHDFNNILGVIMAYTQVCQMNLDSESEVQEYLGHILQASERAKDLIKQILAFSRQSKMEMKPINIHDMLEETVKFLRASMPSTIEIKVSIADIRDHVMGEPSQIQQVIMNICTNARHAMQHKKGFLEIGLERQGIAPENPLCNRGLNSGPCVVMTFRDTGTGMDLETQKRIFEPYFTTKPKEEGTGLGLSFAHGIVKSHGGVIAVESEPGKGSTFRVFLPVMEASGPEKRPESLIDDLPRGAGNILFVDDESFILDSSRHLLEGLGYKVTGRTSPVEALELLKKHPDRFSVVITDQTMPQMTGEELAGHIHDILPKMPIILCTGFSSNLTQERLRNKGVSMILNKPLTIETLARSLKDVLGK